MTEILCGKEKTPDRLKQKDVAGDLERLQNIFIEDFSMAVLAVFEVSLSEGRGTAGTDHFRYRSKAEIIKEHVDQLLSSTRYAKSTKSYKIRKDIPKKADLDNVTRKILENKWREEFLRKRLILLKLCNTKSLRKNYNSTSIRRI